MFDHISDTMTGFKTLEEVEFTYDCLLQSPAVAFIGNCIQYGHDPAKYSSIRKRQASGVVVREYAHRIALMKKIKSTVFPTDLEASHLCHMKACINTEHLIAEPHDINMSRVKCFNESQRLGNHYCFDNHEGYPKCL